MNRRTFLQSVIALPLIVTGEPRITLGVSVPGPYRVGGTGAIRIRVPRGSYFQPIPFDDAMCQAWIDALRRSVDDDALRRFLPNR